MENAIIQFIFFHAFMWNSLIIISLQKMWRDSVISTDSRSISYCPKMSNWCDWWCLLNLNRMSTNLFKCHWLRWFSPTYSNRYTVSISRSYPWHRSFLCVYCYMYILLLSLESTLYLQWISQHWAEPVIKSIINCINILWLWLMFVSRS